MTIKQLDPQALSLHPLRKQLPRWSQTDERFCALVEDIRENGIREPLQVVEPDLVLNEARWLAAKRLQLKTVPCQFIPADEVAGVLISALKRLHLTKSGLAYYVYPAIKPAYRSAVERRMSGLKKGAKTPDFPVSDRIGYGDSMPSVKAVAEGLGISDDVLKMAEKVHEAFAKDTKDYAFTIHGGADDGGEVVCTLKEWFEPKLLGQTTLDEHEGNRPAMGLAAVLKAIGSIKTYQETLKGKRPEVDAIHTFVGAVLAPVRKWRAWSSLDPARKKAALDQFRLELDTMDDQQREETSRAMVDLAAFYERLAKECEDAGKSNS